MTDDFCRVSIVLCTFNRAQLLGPALDAVLSQTEGSPPYEVLVVDNNSRDHTRELVQQRQATAGPRLRYVFEAQQGLSFARNAGIAHARGDLVAFTDDDIRVAPNWVSSIQKAFDEKYDAVMHFAAVASVPESIKSPETVREQPCSKFCVPARRLSDGRFHTPSSIDAPEIPLFWWHRQTGSCGNSVGHRVIPTSKVS